MRIPTAVVRSLECPLNCRPQTAGLRDQVESRLALEDLLSDLGAISWVRFTLPLRLAALSESIRYR